MLPLAIESLAEKFRFFSGVGHRSSLKLSLDILQMPEEKFAQYVNSLREVRDQVMFCSNCGFFAQSDKSESQMLCEICKNDNRYENQLCLVEKPTDVITVERSQIYRGFYHVLNNLISPLDNVFAEDTTISDLIERRLKDFINQKVDKIELILFFKAGFAGEATTAYIREILKEKGMDKFITITKLAQGLPLYYNPDTLDQATMAKALEDRREIK